MTGPRVPAFALAAAFALPAAAQAPFVPLVLQHSGRLLDPSDAPMEGSAEITIRIYDRAGSHRAATRRSSTSARSADCGR